MWAQNSNATLGCEFSCVIGHIWIYSPPILHHFTVNCKWILVKGRSYSHYPVPHIHSPSHFCVKLVTNIDVALQRQARFIIT